MPQETLNGLLWEFGDGSSTVGFRRAWTELDGDFLGVSANEALWDRAKSPLWRAQLWLDARLRPTGLNLGVGGSVLNAQFGSTAGADTNDPEFLAHTGENWLHTPSHWENHLRSTLQYPAATPVVDIRWKGARTLGASSAPFGFWGGASLRSIYVRHVAGGQIGVIWTPDGVFANRVEAQSTVVAPDSGTFRVTVDATTANYQVFFYTSTDDGATWSQLGAGVAGTSVAPGIYGGGDELRVANIAAAGWGHHRLDELKLLAGIDGTPFFEFDAKNDIVNGDAATVTSTSGHTLTVYRPATGRKTVLVTRPTWLFGGDDYMEVANNALLEFGDGESFTLILAMRHWQATVAGSQAFAGMWAQFSGDPAYRGYSLHAEEAVGNILRAQVRDAGATVVGVPWLPGLQLVGMRSDRQANAMHVFRNDTFSAAVVPRTPDLNGAMPFRVGRHSAGGTHYADMEVFGVAVFREALSDADVARIAEYYRAI